MRPPTHTHTTETTNLETKKLGVTQQLESDIDVGFPGAQKLTITILVQKLTHIYTVQTCTHRDITVSCLITCLIVIFFTTRVKISQENGTFTF